MKNLVFFCFVLVCIGFQSCNKNKKRDGDKETKIETEKYVKVECYTAIYEKDTINLKLNTSKEGKIIGNMIMKIEYAPERVGEIKGAFRGDTLFANYTFTQGTNQKRIFKNPMAFLKRDKQLILGNGSIVTSLGVSSFEKGKPIDFEKVKYKFLNVDCDK